MANRNRGALASFLCFLLGIVFGIIGLAGVLVLFITTVKMEKVNDVAKTEIVGSTNVNGEEINLAGMTILEALGSLGTITGNLEDMTLNNLEELLPVLKIGELIPSDMINDNDELVVKFEGSDLVAIPMETLRSKPIKSLGNYLVGEVKKQVSFDLLSTLGMDLDSFPFIKGEDKNGNPIYTYVSLGTGELDEFYKENPDKIYWKDDEGVYHLATEDMIHRVDEASQPQPMSVRPLAAGPVELFYRAQGFSELPIIDGINALVDCLDTSSLTLERMDEMFSLGLRDENGEFSSAIIEKFAHKILGDLATGMEEVMDELVLSDVMEIEEGDVLYSLQYARYTDETAAEYNAKPENADNPVNPGDYVLDEYGKKVKVSIAHLSDSIAYVRIVDLLNSEEDTALIKALGEYTIHDLQNNAQQIVDDMHVSDLLDITEGDALLNAVQFLRFTEETAAAFNLEHGLTGEDAVQWGDKIPVVLEDGSYQTDEEGNVVYVKATVQHLAENVDNVPLGELLGVEEGDNQLLVAMEDWTIGSINDNIDTLELQDVIEINDESARILISLKDAHISDLGERINTLPLSDVIAIDDDSALILQNLKDTPISDLGTKIDTLKLNEVIAIDDDSTKILQTLKNTSIKELGDSINRLTVKDVIDLGDDPSKVLLALKDTSINDLGSRMDTLTLAEIVEYDPDGDTVFDRMMKEAGDATLSTMDDKLSHVHLTRVFDVYERDISGNIVYEGGKPCYAGVWYFLFKGTIENDKGETVDADQATLSDLEAIMNNAPENIGNATIRELVEQGVLTGMPAENESNRTLYDYSFQSLLQALSQNWNVVGGLLGGSGS